MADPIREWADAFMALTPTATPEQVERLIKADVALDMTLDALMSECPDGGGVAHVLMIRENGHCPHCGHTELGQGEPE